ncbi:MAG: methyltransferase domain-containing protein [Rhodospirillales bacterium]
MNTKSSSTDAPPQESRTAAKDREPPWAAGFKLSLEMDFVQSLLQQLLRNPAQLFQISEVCESAARRKLENLNEDEVRFFGDDPPDAIDTTGTYNFEELKKATAFTRPKLLINPLMSIDLVRMRAGNLKVLTVGPRSESEIFMLLAAGFSPKRIRGLDLFSYSEFVDVGDMHDMPYPDGTFDVVILGWVLAYSKNLEKVAAEVRRVTAPGAFVAAGCLYFPYTREQLMELDGDSFSDPTRFYTTNDILALWRDQIAYVPFRHDIHPAMSGRLGDIMTIFQFAG